jgi:hypothetical protein
MISFGKEMFKLNLGYYRPNFSTTAAVGATGGTPPGDINPEEDLGLENNLGGARFDGYWRFADRHRAYFGYYKLDRTGSKVLTKDIGPIDIPNYGMETILAGSNIQSESKWEVFILGYGYSFHKSEDLEIAGKIGLNVVRLGTKLTGTLITSGSGTLTGTTAGSELTAPLPAIGVTGDWALDDRWRLRGNLGVFQFKFDTIYANVVDASVAAEYRVYRNLWAGAGYSILNASVKSDKPDTHASLDWRTGGWQLYASYLF